MNNFTRGIISTYSVAYVCDCECRAQRDDCNANSWDCLNMYLFIWKQTKDQNRPL